MPAPAWIRISRRCNNACSFCDASRALDNKVVSWTSIERSLERSAAQGRTAVVFAGGEPTLSEHLVRGVARARALGMSPIVSTNGRLLADPERFRRLVAAGVETFRVPLHGATAATHNALVGGDPIAHRQTLQCIAQILETPGVSWVLQTTVTASNQHEVVPLVQHAIQKGADGVRLHRLRGPDSLSEDALSAIWWAVREACTEGEVPLDAVGFARPRPLQHGAADAPAPFTDRTRALLAEGWRTPEILAGVTMTTPEDGPEPHHLAAHHVPVVGDVAPQTQLRGELRAEAHVHIVIGSGAPPLTAISTLPALAHLLRESGLTVTLHQPFGVGFDPVHLRPQTPQKGLIERLFGSGYDTPDGLIPPGDPGFDAAAAAAHDMRRLAAIDVSTADLVIVAGDLAAELLAASPTLRAGVEVICLEPDRRLGEHPDLCLRSARPGALLGAAHPAEAIRWRPYPLYLPHLPEPSPPGHGLAVWPTLGHAQQQILEKAGLGDTPPTLLDPDGQPEALIEALVAAVALWIPEPTDHPQTGQIMALAHALGRPVVAPETPTFSHHVVHGHDGLLTVPRHRGDTITQLRRLLDTPQLAHLHEGAHARREAYSLTHWVDELMHGPRTTRLVRRAGVGMAW